MSDNYKLDGYLLVINLIFLGGESIFAINEWFIFFFKKCVQFCKSRKRKTHEMINNRSKIMKINPLYLNNFFSRADLFL